MSKQIDPAKTAAACNRVAAHARAACKAPATEPEPTDGAPTAGRRLLDKRAVLQITNVTYPTLWAWMRAGKFPRARIVGGKSMWLTSEVDAWLAALPVRKLKGDEPTKAA